MKAPFKAGSWWSYKIPPMLAVAYFALAIAPQPPAFAEVRWHFALYLVAVIAIAAFGHLLTDAFDVDEDRALGKQNLWSPLPVLARWSLVLLLLIVSWLPWLAMPGQLMLLQLIALQFLLYFLYAAPPVRLKERGFWGILADAGYAHTLPALWTWVPFSRLSGVQVPAWLIVLLSVWTLSIGVRHLLQHQVVQLEADHSAGVATHAVRRGREATLALIVRPVLVIEMTSFAMLLVIVGSQFWFIPAAFLGFVALRLLRTRQSPFVGAARDDSSIAAGIGTMILTRFYERWLPLLILTGLVVREPSYFTLLVLHVLLFGRGLLELLRDDLPAVAGRAFDRVSSRRDFSRNRA